MLIGYPYHVSDYLTGNGVVPLDKYIDNPTVGLSADSLADFVPAIWKKINKHLMEILMDYHSINQTKF